MLCALFAERLAYLERKHPMRLDNITRTVTRARKRHALAVASLASADNPKAARRAERKAKSARRAMLEAARCADFLDWSGQEA